ncbi:hypothetical protein NLU13_9914 [Sarocladium strictum]|uniref:Ran-specific GTPase-activating protein 30 n=1 Tax=Sarocladium strictum TaxID=5046 RepID=A0AA39L3R0_SARSR|nr:hypothetical protein NLU13_9914 [Sarocladium strictum]
MDEFLSIVGVQAMRYAIRSSIALASTYAVGQLSHLVNSAEDPKTYAEWNTLHSRFESKIKIISPVIDLIELKSGRGNVFLESAAPITQALQRDITVLTHRIEQILQSAQHFTVCVPDQARKDTVKDVMLITQDLHRFLDRVDREIPLLQLAVTASGETLSTSLPSSISPSRLLQASTLLVAGDIQFSRDPTQPVHIGPVFCLSMYMLFRGHAPNEASDGTKLDCSDGRSSHAKPYGLGPSDRKPLWQQVVHKARVRLIRTTSSSEGHRDEDAQRQSYHYLLEIEEDLDDGLLHDPRPASRRDLLPVSEVSKLFYTDAGRILNLGHDDSTDNEPVLLLKVDTKSDLDESTRTTTDSNVPGVYSNRNEQVDIDRQILSELHQTGRCSQSPVLSSELRSMPHLDPEWLAFEIFKGDDAVPKDLDNTSSDEEDTTDDVGKGFRTLSCSTEGIATKIEELKIHEGEPGSEQADTIGAPSESPLGAITTSLSLFEMLIRLASLQEFQQSSHLAIPDHILTFFLEETSSTGLAGESQSKARQDAKCKVGFDPYTDGRSEER